MAFVFSSNNLYTSHQECLFRWYEKLTTTGGWTVVSSGDGTGGNFSGVGNVLTTFSTTTDAVANAITNRRAWARLQSPDGRELLFMHSSINTATDVIGLLYSPALGFVGTGDGAISALVAPTAADGCIVIGERRGTLTLSGTSFCNGIAGNNRMDFAFGDASEGYAFYALTRQSAGTGAYMGGMIYDRVASPVPADPDGTVIFPVCEASGSPFAVNSNHLCTSSPAWVWGMAGVSGEATLSSRFACAFPIGGAPHPTAMCKQCIIRPAPAGIASFNTIVNPMGLNPYDSEVDLIEPAYWGSISGVPSSAVGSLGQPGVFGHVKGESRLIKAISGATGFANLDTNVALTRIGQTGGFWLLWDGVTTPTL